MVVLHMLLFVPMAASVGLLICAVFAGAKVYGEKGEGE